MDIKPNLASLVPYVKLEYYEFDRRIDKSVELCSDLIIVDGFFFPTGVNRFSLGYQVSLNRKEESVKNLRNFGHGIGFYRTEVDDYYVRSLTSTPVYIKLNNSEEQILLNSGENKRLFNLNTCVKEAALPPKKKTVNFQDFIVRVSLEEPFKAKNNGELFSPCWVMVNLVKFIDINLAKKSFIL